MMSDRLPMLRWMQGTGNRFAIADQADLQDRDPSELARLLAAHPHRPDGLLVLAPDATTSDVAMRIFNSDGSEARMCGNGLRCVVYDQVRRGLVGAGPARIRVGDHVLEGRVQSISGQEALVCTTMPVPTIVRTEGLLQVELGNMHVIVMHDQLPSEESWRYQVGKLHEQGLNDVNLHAVQILSEDTIAMSSWERGVGPTLACASWATAAVSGLASMNRIQDSVLVKQPGGELRVHWQGDGAQPTNSGMVGDLDEDEQGPSGNNMRQRHCEQT